MAVSLEKIYYFCRLKKIKVQIPAGIQNNEKIRMIGLGKPGINGGKSGDLFVKVKIEKDKDFILDGYDIKSNLYITPWEAALSTKVNVKTIDEEKKIRIIPTATNATNAIVRST